MSKNQQKYVIVKHAGFTQQFHWEQDPKETGVNICHSAYGSYSGQCSNIKESYNDLNEAKNDCNKINKSNPSGDYAVCKLIEESTNV